MLRIRNNAGLYDIYIDDIVEKITWTNGTNRVVVENFDNLSTNYFTAYVYGTTSNYSVADVTEYPITLYDDKIGYAIDKI